MTVINDTAMLLSKAGLPIDTALRDVAVARGVRKHRYYGWDVVEIADASLPVEQACPLWINSIGVESDLLPAATYSTLIGREPSLFDSLRSRSTAHDNHKVAEQALSRWLGASTQDRTSANVICHRWYSDNFAIRLTTWPPELNQEIPNPTADANSILRHAAHLDIHDKRVPAAEPHEALWLRAYTPIPLLNSDVRLDMFERSELGVLRGIARRMPATKLKQVPALALSADGEALVRIGIKTALLLPRSMITGLQLVHLKPAKGAGGGFLSVDYRDPYSSRDLERSLSLASSASINGVDTLGERLAAWAQRPLTIVEDYDV